MVPAAFRRGAEELCAAPYDEEQWDVMFFVQGVAEMILRDAARRDAGRARCASIIDGDNHRSAQQRRRSIIPPGVAHAIRVEGSEDVIMVYGTSTSFRPEFEGRIASEVETATLPESWQRFLDVNSGACHERSGSLRRQSRN